MIKLNNEKDFEFESVLSFFSNASQPKPSFDLSGPFAGAVSYNKPLQPYPSLIFSAMTQG